MDKKQAARKIFIRNQLRFPASDRKFDCIVILYPIHANKMPKKTNVLIT